MSFPPPQTGSEAINPPRFFVAFDVTWAKQTRERLGWHEELAEALAERLAVEKEEATAEAYTGAGTPGAGRQVADKRVAGTRASGMKVAGRHLPEGARPVRALKLDNRGSAAVMGALVSMTVRRYRSWQAEAEAGKLPGANRYESSQRDSRSRHLILAVCWHWPDRSA